MSRSKKFETVVCFILAIVAFVVLSLADVERRELLCRAIGMFAMSYACVQFTHCIIYFYNEELFNKMNKEEGRKGFGIRLGNGLALFITGGYVLLRANAIITEFASIIGVR